MQLQERRGALTQDHDLHLYRRLIAFAAAVIYSDGEAIMPIELQKRSGEAADESVCGE